jgi:PBP1b-binding outer membrane lipoprotein LpoB
MKKSNILGLVVVAVLLTGCGEKKLTDEDLNAKMQELNALRPVTPTNYKMVATETFKMSMVFKQGDTVAMEMRNEGETKITSTVLNYNVLFDDDDANDVEFQQEVEVFQDTIGLMKLGMLSLDTSQDNVTTYYYSLDGNHYANEEELKLSSGTKGTKHTTPTYYDYRGNLNYATSGRIAYLFDYNLDLLLNEEGNNLAGSTKGNDLILTSKIPYSTEDMASEVGTEGTTVDTYTVDERKNEDKAVLNATNAYVKTINSSVDVSGTATVTKDGVTYNVETLTQFTVSIKFTNVDDTKLKITFPEDLASYGA